MKTIAILDSYWVIQGKLMAGEFPGAFIDDEARGRLCWLLEQGVNACLDLTEDELDCLPQYTKILSEQAGKMGITVSYVRMGIRDFSVPSVEQMNNILDKLDATIHQGQTVYVHCCGGIGRTGTVVGCYLVRHGLNGEEALRQIASWRKQIPSGWVKSPETEEQRRYILNWDKAVK